MITETQRISPEADPAGRLVGLSESAVARIRRLREIEGDEALMVRITVDGGGCSGFQYKFDFDSAAREDDHVFERGGVRIVTDDTSLDLLNGSELDFVEEMIGASFQMRNPNASSSCGCGASFSLA